MKKLRLQTPKTAPPPRRILLLIQRDRRICLYAGQGGQIVPLPEGIPSSLALPHEESEQPPQMIPFPGIWDEIRLCLCATNVVYRTWHFPFTGTGKVRQALRLALDSELPFSDNALTHALSVRKNSDCKGHSVALSASVKTSLLEELLHVLRQAGLEPDVITPDPCPALEPGYILEGAHCFHVFLREEHSIIVEARHGEVETVHVSGIGQQEFQAAGIGALHQEIKELFAAPPFTPPDEAPELILHMETDPADKLGDPAVALLRMRKPALSFPVSRKRVASSHWTRATLCYAAVIVAALFALWTESGFQERRAARMAQAAVALFRQTLPELGGRTFGSMQMESILRQRLTERHTDAAQENRMSMVAFLEKLHQAVPSALDIRISNIRMTRGICSLSCLAPDYESVARFKAVLESTTGATSVLVRNAAQVSSGLSARRDIQFEVELRLKQDTP